MHSVSAASIGNGTCLSCNQGLLWAPVLAVLTLLRVFRETDSRFESHISHDCIYEIGARSEVPEASLLARYTVSENDPCLRCGVDARWKPHSGTNSGNCLHSRRGLSRRAHKTNGWKLQLAGMLVQPFGRHGGAVRHANIHFRHASFDPYLCKVSIRSPHFFRAGIP